MRPLTEKPISLHEWAPPERRGQKGHAEWCIFSRPQRPGEGSLFTGLRSAPFLQNNLVRVAHAVFVLRFFGEYLPPVSCPSLVTIPLGSRNGQTVFAVSFQNAFKAQMSCHFWSLAIGYAGDHHPQCRYAHQWLYPTNCFGCERCLFHAGNACVSGPYTKPRQNQPRPQQTDYWTHLTRKPHSASQPGEDGHEQTRRRDKPGGNGGNPGAT